MRPRISSFGKITYSEINKYLTENAVYGFVVEIKKDTYVYTYNIMYRSNKKDPEILYLEVSQVSKLVVGAWTNCGRKFNNVEELKTYTKR